MVLFSQPCFYFFPQPLSSCFSCFLLFLLWCFGLPELFLPFLSFALPLNLLSVLICQRYVGRALCKIERHKLQNAAWACSSTPQISKMCIEDMDCVCPGMAPIHFFVEIFLPVVGDSGGDISHVVAALASSQQQACDQSSRF